MYNKLSVIQIKKGFIKSQEKTLTLFFNNNVGESEYSPNIDSVSIIYYLSLNEFLKHNNKYLRGSNLILKDLGLDLIFERIYSMTNESIIILFNTNGNDDQLSNTININLEGVKLFWYIDNSVTKCYINDCDCHTDGFFDYVEGNEDDNQDNNCMKLYHLNLDSNGHGHFDNPNENGNDCHAYYNSGFFNCNNGANGGNNGGTNGGNNGGTNGGNNGGNNCGNNGGNNGGANGGNNGGANGGNNGGANGGNNGGANGGANGCNCNNNTNNNTNNNSNNNCSSNDLDSNKIQDHPFNIYNNKYTTSNSNSYNQISDLNCSDKIEDDENNNNNSVKLNIGVMIPLTGLLFNEGKFASDALKFVKEYVLNVECDFDFNFIQKDIKSDNEIANNIKDMHRHENVDVFIIGPIDNNKLLVAEEYILSNNLLVLIFGPSYLKKENTKNIISISPDINFQSKVLSEYVKLKKVGKFNYVIPVLNSNIYGTVLFNYFKKNLENSDSINLQFPINYVLETMSNSLIFENLKNQVSYLINTKNVQKNQITVLFLSSYEILTFIAYILSVEDNSILEEINWIGCDKNHIIFDSYLNHIYYDELNLNEKKISLNRIKQFLINVNFICLTQDYEETNSNNEILANISYNPIALGIADSFWLIANSFLRTKSLNKSKLLNTILGISSCQFGLTGNLELDKNGARKYFKYCIRKGYIYNEKFVWERVGTCDNKVGLTLEY